MSDGPRFDRVAVLDWSGARVPKRGKDSIWLAMTDADGTVTENPATRREAEARLGDVLQNAREAGARLLLGVDFGFGYPAGFAATVSGQAAALPLWDHFAARLTDDARNHHSGRTLAAEINGRFSGDGPFWGNGAAEDVPGLPRLKPPLPEGLAPHRATEEAARAGGAHPKSAWQLSGAGAVGMQMLTGLPVLARLRHRFAGQIAVWPFEPPDAPLVLAEIYPSLLMAEAKARAATDGLVLDDAQVRVLAEALFYLHAGDNAGPLWSPPGAPEVLREEGWILGVCHTLALRQALPARAAPPRLRNDCFAMPQGVDWVPVDTALDRLRAALHPIQPVERVATDTSAGRILARDVTAQRSNPPMPNAAVDGYGFAAAATGDGPQRLPLARGRAAAGAPFTGTVAPGEAVRILTGAILPEGVDTVVLEEDTTLDQAAVIFDGPVKPGANTRKAGEDVPAGDLAVQAGQRLRAPDVALLSALGIAEVPVFGALRVGVLSTGDEIVASPALPARPHQIWDANRPMLLRLVEDFGHVAVDLGHVRDDRDAIAARLSAAAGAEVDAILTSGGASAGDEDHVSALLRDQGTLSSWRIALKPGRPLALALWESTPIFGLPGNPVAALVCALIFARPALSLLAGAGWAEPTGFDVPAAFTKRKKPGRREYLRARLTSEGTAEVFASEGSGRISGLSWATGLVELPDAEAQIAQGDPVRYLPFGLMGMR